MVCSPRAERRQVCQGGQAEARGALRSLPDGTRLPNLLEAGPLMLGDPGHPARLRASDLENPQGFHQRLTAWLLRQG